MSGRVERLVREMFAPWDDVVMGDPGGNGPGEKDVVALIHKILPEMTAAYETAMQAEGIKRYRRACVHRAAIKAFSA